MTDWHEKARDQEWRDNEARLRQLPQNSVKAQELEARQDELEYLAQERAEGKADGAGGCRPE